MQLTKILQQVFHWQFQVRCGLDFEARTNHNCRTLFIQTQCYIRVSLFDRDDTQTQCQLYAIEWIALVAVLDSWDNVTSQVYDVITAVRGNMAVVPCDVSWTSRPPATLQFERHPQPLTTLPTSKLEILRFISK